MTDSSPYSRNRMGQPTTMVAERVAPGVNPYGSATETSTPRSDVYAVLRQDADEREKKEDFHLTTLSSLTLAPAPEPEARLDSFADFMAEGEVVAEDTEVTQIFAGLEGVEAPSGVWRRGDDDVIGTGTPTRSARRRSLRLRRRAA